MFVDTAKAELFTFVAKSEALKNIIQNDYCLPQNTVKSSIEKNNSLVNENILSPRLNKEANGEFSKEPIDKVTSAKEQMSEVAYPEESIAEAMLVEPVTGSKLVVEPITEVKLLEPFADIGSENPIGEVKLVKPIDQVTLIKPVVEVKLVEPIAEVRVTQLIAEAKLTKPITEADLPQPAAEVKLEEPTPGKTIDENAMAFERFPSFAHDGTISDDDEVDVVFKKRLLADENDTIKSEERQTDEISFQEFDMDDNICSSYPVDSSHNFLNAISCFEQESESEMIEATQEITAATDANEEIIIEQDSAGWVRDKIRVEMISNSNGVPVECITIDDD
uniref:Titin-like n=1 Tax=Rhabditophanes sp. KR3021 TaxID=114890 RepID=A0AC35U0Q0_9BILA